MYYILTEQLYYKYNQNEVIHKTYFEKYYL